MNDAMPMAMALALSGLAGLALGAFFFGGLWWTVRKLVDVTRPALWVFASLWLRMGIAMVGFYFVAQGHWERLVACLLGFVVARLLVSLLTRAPEAHQPRDQKEPRHAP